MPKGTGWLAVPLKAPITAFVDGSLSPSSLSDTAGMWMFDSG